MPAPGDQHLSSGGRTIPNPFEEVKPRISEYTAQEIATLQSRLEKQLGPEYISSRAGPSGQKVHYLAAEKCIQLANEIFGFNGWSSQIKDVQVDFVEENPITGKVSLGLSVVVRVSLRDGTFHEDIGYGHIENCKGKAAAFEKSKKEGTTDALKRALRNFGNVLGNCIYDKEYVAKVTKIKAAPMTKWDVDGLHRHSNYAPVKKEPLNTEATKSFKQETSTSDVSAPDLTSVDSFDEEFGEFDDADFGVTHDSDSHPDEVILPAPPTAHQFTAGRPNGEQTRNTMANGNVGHSNQGRPPAANRGATMPAPARPQNSIQGPANNVARNVNMPIQQLQQPQTPTNGFARSNSGVGPGISSRPQPDNPGTGRPSWGPPPGPPGPPRVLNQPSRTGPPSAPSSPGRNKKPSILEGDGPGFDIPPVNVGGGAGFFSARGLNKDGHEAQGAAPLPAAHLTAFDPKAESPSIRKTPGIDHTKTKPLSRDGQHVSGTQSNTGVSSSQAKVDIVNPQLNTARRIGAPGSPSPLANRGQYKPPTMKRPIEGGNNLPRAPLEDISSHGNVPTSEGGNDFKRQRVNGS